MLHLAPPTPAHHPHVAGTHSPFMCLNVCVWVLFTCAIWHHCMHRQILHRQLSINIRQVSHNCGKCGKSAERCSACGTHAMHLAASNTHTHTHIAILTRSGACTCVSALRNSISKQIRNPHPPAGR